MYVQTLSRSWFALAASANHVVRKVLQTAKRRLESRASQAGAASRMSRYSRAKRVCGPHWVRLRQNFGCESGGQTVWLRALRNCQLWRASLKHQTEAWQRGCSFCLWQIRWIKHPRRRSSTFGRVHGGFLWRTVVRAGPCRNGLRPCLIDVPNVDPARSSSDAG